jgi:hypothetical protein
MSVSESVFSHPTASYASKWQTVKDLGIMFTVGTILFCAGHWSGSLQTEASHKGEYSAAIAEIATDNQEEAERFDELTSICKNRFHARHSCRSSYRDANAQRISKVQQPTVQGAAPTEDDNSPVLQAGRGSGAT